MSSPLRILFVCTANICRSPFLELYARARLTSPDVEFASAGTHAVAGQPMSQEMSVEARRHWGLEVEGFRSRLLTAELLAGTDLVLTAATRHQEHILTLHPDAAGRVFTLGQAVRGAPVATPDDDIADPYHLGAQAQATAARRMAGMLDVLSLPGLRDLTAPAALTNLLDLSPARRPAHG